MASIAWVVCRVFTFASVTAEHFLHLTFLFHTFMLPSTSPPHTPTHPPATSTHHNLSHIYLFLRLSWVSIATFFCFFFLHAAWAFLWLFCHVWGAGNEMNVKRFFRSSASVVRNSPLLRHYLWAIPRAEWDQENLASRPLIGGLLVQFEWLLRLERCFMKYSQFIILMTFAH